jgi:hypothetical protein
MVGDLVTQLRSWQEQGFFTNQDSMTTVQKVLTEQFNYDQQFLKNHQ